MDAPDPDKHSACRGAPLFVRCREMDEIKPGFFKPATRVSVHSRSLRPR